MLRDGWPEGIQGVSELAGLATDESERHEIYRDVAGFHPDVPSTIAGTPCDMFAMRRTTSASKRSVTLVNDASYNAGVTAETAQRHAIEVMKLVSHLVAEGIDCEVYNVQSIQMRKLHTVYVTPVRTLGSPIMPERIASLLHPSFLRRSWFAMAELEKDKGMKGSEDVVPSSYGRAMRLEPALIKAVLPDAVSVVIMPKPGDGATAETLYNTVNLKLQREE
jgi:hypothetical protein